MKILTIGLGISLVVLGSLSFGQQAPAAAKPELFLAPTDVPRVLRLAPGLVKSTNKGVSETRAYLATQELSQRQISQILTNVSVAYTAVKIEEYLKQVQPLLDEKSKDQQYRQFLEKTQKELADLTQKYRAAQKDGRSALDVNKEYVIKNQAAVEELMMHIRSMRVDSLPKNEE